MRAAEFVESCKEKKSEADVPCYRSCIPFPVEPVEPMKCLNNAVQDEHRFCTRKKRFYGRLSTRNMFTTSEALLFNHRSLLNALVAQLQLANSLRMPLFAGLVLQLLALLLQVLNKLTTQ